MTPLMHAAAGVGTMEKVKALLQAGVDRFLKDNSGRTALDIARTPESSGAWRFGAQEVIKLLEEVMRGG